MLVKNIKKCIRNIMYHTGTLKYLKYDDRDVRILMYHGIDTTGISPQLFEEQINFLMSHHHIITLKDLIAGNIRKGKMNIILSFDDGLKSNALCAYNVLKKYQVPAIYFVCPGLIDRQEWLWNHEVRQRLQYASEKLRSEIANSIGVSNHTINGIVESLKIMSEHDRKYAINIIKNETCHYKPSLSELEKFDIMTWDDVNKLDPEIITIGAHTVNHSVLSTLESNECEYEIVECKTLLEERLGRKVDYFCYPNGNYDTQCEQIVSRHYCGAVTTDEGFAKPGDNRYRLKRIPAAREMPLFVWRLYRPTA